jgi:hypothetical protein
VGFGYGKALVKDEGNELDTGLDVVEFRIAEPVVCVTVAVELTTISVELVEFVHGDLVGRSDVALIVVTNGTLVCEKVDVELVSAGMRPDGDDVGWEDVPVGREGSAAEGCSPKGLNL